MARALVLPVVATAVLANGATAAHADVTVTWHGIRHGVSYRKIVDTDGPWVIHVVRITPVAEAVVDGALAGPTIGSSFLPTSTIGANAGALVAINGDFAGDGIPMDPWAGDASLLTSGVQGDAAIMAFHAAGKGAELSDTGLRIRVNDLARPAGGHKVARWNVAGLGPESIAAFTPFGGTKITPPNDACTARLAPKKEPRWGPAGVGVDRDYVVQARRCSQTPLGVRDGTVVLAGSPTGKGGAWIAALKRDRTVRLHWDVGVPETVDAFGGHPALLSDGVVVAEACDGYLCKQHPRTAIGVTAKGTILLMVVDGRSSASVGMTLTRLARYLKKLGAVDAVNLDGGGSATMWVAGLGVMNRPSDGHERRVENAIVVLPGPDPDEPVPLPAA